MSLKHCLWGFINMARVLRLYANFTPNQSNNTFYMYVNTANYLTKILGHLKQIEIPLDNYRINTGVIKIKKDLIIDFDIKNCTYAIEWEKGISATRTFIYKCYHVRSYEELDYYILNVEVDLWGTYLKDAELTNINVTRCNRNIGVGVYDEIESTTETDEEGRAFVKPRLNNSWLDTTGTYGHDDYISIVYVVEHNIKQQVFGEDYISMTKMYYSTFTHLRSLVKDEYKNKSGVEIASDVIGGIYGATGNLGTLDARVIKAWVLPNVLFYNSGLARTLKSKCAYSNGEDITITAGEIIPRRDSLQFTAIPFDINYATYFGTYNFGLKLKRYTQPANIYCEIVTNIGPIDLQVLVKQGEDQKDITQCFEIPLTTNSSVTTLLRQIAKSFTISVGASRNMVSDFTNGGGGASGAVNAGLGFANTIMGMINLTPRIDKAIGSGGATNIYYSTYTETHGSDTWHYSLNPFVVTTFKSVYDENAHARYYGASFNEFITDLSTIDSYELLGTGDNLTLTDTFIVANVRVDNVSKEAKDYIQNAFRNGIYLKYIH